MKTIVVNVSEDEVSEALSMCGVDPNADVEFGINENNIDRYFYTNPGEPVVMEDWNISDRTGSVYMLDYDEFLKMYNKDAEESGTPKIEMIEPGVFKREKGRLFAFRSIDPGRSIEECVVISNSLENAEFIVNDFMYDQEQVEVPESVTEFVNEIDRLNPDWLREKAIGFIVSKNIISRSGVK